MSDDLTQIRYVTTADGVTIALRVSGSGPGVPLVYMHTPGMSLLTREAVRLRDVMVVDPTEFIKSRPIAVFDFRGCGLSERGVTDMSMPKLMLDLEAVVKGVGWSHFALVGFGMAGPIAIEYTAKNPDRVTSLVLRETYARASDMARIPRVRIHGAALQLDWDTYIELMIMMSFRWAAEGEALANALKEGVSHDVMLALAAATGTYDAREFLAGLDIRTLVIGREDVPVPSPEMVRQLGAQIANSRVLFVGGGIGTIPDAYRYIESFLAEADPQMETRAAESGLPSGFRTILFTDLVGHTEMMSRLGDEKGRDVLREHERITREVLKANGGTEVKTMGDGFMASFGSVTKAVECAVALQRAFAEQEGEALNVRVGLNAGEPIEEDGDLFGATVILASRIAAKAEGGEILVADTVRGLCSGKGFTFADRGEFAAKGFEEPVRVYEVSWRS